MRFIHRNAVSNACKYGELGGVVPTHISFDEEHSLLTVNIANAPGAHHERLLELGAKAASRVFESGQRLHDKFGRSDDREVSISSGDGAWIMRKCARILGGDVSIVFNQERTVFSLAIPAKPVKEIPDIPKCNFSMPSRTIGVAIDDSIVQRLALW